MIRNQPARRFTWFLLPAIALGGAVTLAACGSDSETVTKRTVIEDQPTTVRTETTTTTVEED